MPGGRALSDFTPDWVDTGPPREHMGVELDCPAHRDHRLRLWFANPGDGEEPATPEQVINGGGYKYFYRVGDELETLSILDAIEVRGHWSGWLLDGRVFVSFITGVAW